MSTEIYGVMRRSYCVVRFAASQLGLPIEGIKIFVYPEIGDVLGLEDTFSVTCPKTLIPDMVDQVVDVPVVRDEKVMLREGKYSEIVIYNPDWDDLYPKQQSAL